MYLCIFLFCFERFWCVEYCWNVYRCYFLDVVEMNFEFEECEQGSNCVLLDWVCGQLGYDLLINLLYGVLFVVI